jgi:hypothetical protein
LGGVDIHVKYGHGVDPYFDIPMRESVNGWSKIWFFLRNDAAAPLSVFTGNRPIPQPNWWYRVAKKSSASYNPCVRSFNSYDKQG